MDDCQTSKDIDTAVDVITHQIQDSFFRACPLQNMRKPAKCKFTPEIESKIKEKRKFPAVELVDPEHTNCIHQQCNWA